YVHDQRKINFLCRGDIFLFPSHYQEGMPYALLEAMAAGLPVIATSTGGIPEIIEHNINGILIPPGEPAKLSQAINKLLANRRLREEFGTKNRHKTETEYDIKIVCEKFNKLYKRLSNQDRTTKNA
ncbi:MAG: glycosyltransferase family 4 protein, partial [Gammaproteobacteria bacterium]|nr:glycosyltransferase family 4 protein [Gammaproteobacteria bacterium]